MRSDRTPAEIDDIRSRRKIYRLIRETPGIHFRELLRETGFASGTLQYHLNEMVRSEILTESKDEHYTRYFIKESPLSISDKTILKQLRKELPRGIILFILQNPGCENRDLKRHFSVSSATISYHMKRLIRNSIIISEGDTRMQRYSVSEPGRVLELLLMFRSSFLDEMVDALLESWVRE